MAARTTNTAKTLEPLDEVARLLALTLKRERGLNEVIVELRDAGFGRSRIAELLATSPGYVDVALTRAKKQTKKAPAKRSAPKPATP